MLWEAGRTGTGEKHPGNSFWGIGITGVVFRARGDGVVRGIGLLQAFDPSRVHVPDGTHENLPCRVGRSAAPRMFCEDVLRRGCHW